MTISEYDLQQLCKTAMQAALAAGRYIASVDPSKLLIEHKSAGTSQASQVVTAVDHYCEQLIRDALFESCQAYDLALLSEESASEHAREAKNRFSQPYFWCVDPLDGTLPFTQSKPGYAVSIALVSRSGRPVIGVVYDPVEKVLYSATSKGGAFKDGAPLNIQAHASKESSPLVVFADNSFKDEAGHGLVNTLTKTVGAPEQHTVYGNGAVKNACGITGYAQACYFKSPKTSAGGGSIWDFAATACIIAEAGGWVSAFSGQTLDLNATESTFMNRQGVIFATNAELAKAIMLLSK